MKAEGGALKYVMLAGVGLLCVLAVLGGLRRNAPHLVSDPKIALVKNFFRTRLDQKYVDPVLLGSAEGQAKMKAWSDRLKEEYAGIYVPKYASPGAAFDQKDQRRVTVEDIAIKEMLPMRVKALAPLHYEVASSLSITSEQIRFPAKYFYSTVTLIERGENTYIADFRVARFSGWAPGSPQAEDERKRLDSGAP